MQHTLGNLAQLYIALYTAEGSHTRRAKRRDLLMFLAFLQGKGHCPPLLKHWTHGLSIEFRDSRLKEGAAPATVYRELATLKHFGRALSDKYGIRNPMDNIKSPKPLMLKPKRLTDSQLSMVLQVAGTIGHSDYLKSRNVCVIMLALETALRASEIIALSLEQVSLADRIITNILTKGSKITYKPITERLLPILTNYIQERKRFARHSPALFVSSRGGRMSYEALKRLMHQVGDVSGFRLHAHLLRHTKAHRVYEHTKDIRAVQKVLGHADIKTSMKYAGIEEEELRRAYEA